MLKLDDTYEEEEEEENEFIEIVYKIRRNDQKEEYNEIIKECLDNGFCLNDLMDFNCALVYEENLVPSKMRGLFVKIDNVLKVFERHINYKIFADMARSLYKLFAISSKFVDFCISDYCDENTKKIVNRFLGLASRAFLEINKNVISEGLNRSAKNLMNNGFTNEDLLLFQDVYSLISNLISAEDAISENKD